MTLASARWWTNTGASFPNDAYGRNQEYVPDPVAEIRRQFKAAQESTVFVIGQVQGNPTKWKPDADGKLQATGQKDFSASLASVGSDEMQALLRGIYARTTDGLSTWIYTGRFLSTNGLIVNRTTPVIGDNFTTAVCLRRWYGPLLEAGVDRIIFDCMSGPVDSLRLIDMARKSLKLQLAGNAWPIIDIGKGTAVGGRRYKVDAETAKKVPWVAIPQELEAVDPNGEFMLPVGTDCRVRICDAEYPDPKDAIAEVQKYKAMNAGIDWLGDVRPEVQAAA